MIGKLTGTVGEVAGSQLILDVGGVGYLVSASATTLRQIGPAGSPVSLLIETQVREDAIALFGFARRDERDAFRLLVTVQGVGAKSALAILGLMPPEKLAAAIMAQDKAALTRAEGVGPKLALRLVTELKDKVATLGFAFAPTAAGTLAKAPAMSAGGGAVEDATSALLNLGYRRLEAFAAVMRAAEKLGSEAALADLLRASLAELGRSEGA
jgi:Holliday junction DNA helicase RuvA